MYKDITAGSITNNLIYQCLMYRFPVRTNIKYSINASKVHHPKAAILFQKKYSYTFFARYRKPSAKDHIVILKVKTKNSLHNLDFLFNLNALKPT
ncbi:MAG: hypothetical protein PHF63_12225 [Herbinix sp.]|nr:hypothetical protein [Herbinix sp.]